MRIGDTNGFGRYGILDVVDGLLICHECGRGWKQLATHLKGAHGILADEYRRAHGLALTERLVAPSVRKKMSESWDRNAALHLASLDASRKPGAVAASHVRPQSEWTAATRARRHEMLKARRGRLLTDVEMSTLGDDLPMAAWCERVRQILADDKAVTQGSVGRSFGMDANWVHQRLRRYPPTP